MLLWKPGFFKRHVPLESWFFRSFNDTLENNRWIDIASNKMGKDTMKKKILLFFLAAILFSNIGGFSKAAAQCQKLCNIGFWKSASLADVKNALAHADVNARNKNDGSTPLHHAVVESKTPEIVKLLLDRGAEINARTTGADVDPSSGSTPLHFATTPEIVKLLLDRGAKIDARNKYGWTPIHFAIVQLLLFREVEINARSEGGEIPPHFAARFSETPVIVDLLLSRGAKINTRAAGGGTPLHGAASSETPEIVKLLLDRGARIDARGRNDETPAALRGEE